MSETNTPILNQIRLLVDDFPTVYRFYRDVVGLTPGAGNETDVYASLSAGATAIALFRRELMAEAIGQEIGAPRQPLSPMVIVFEVADVDAAWIRLEASSAALAGPTDHPDWGIRTVHLRDPEGTIVELYVELPSPH